jgi:hypothetical protein
MNGQSPDNRVPLPFLGEDTKGSAVLSAERTVSPLKKQQGGFFRPANFSLSNRLLINNLMFSVSQIQPWQKACSS